MPPSGERPPAQQPRASWLAAADNRFGVPILNLWEITGKLISTTQNPAAATTSMSWPGRTGSGLDLAVTLVSTHDCALRYPAATELPAGLMFTPREMEEKWVIAWRDEMIVLARSWTGEVVALGHTRRDGPDALVVERLSLVDESLTMFGDPVETFDWLIRTHALRQVLPLPVSAAGAQMLENVPLMVFGPHGHKATCAALGWQPPPPTVPLRTDGALLVAVRQGSAPRVRELVGAGASLSAPGTHVGYTVLHFAVLKGDAAMVRLLLSLGADPDLPADRGFTPLIAAVVYKAPQEILQILADSGATVSRTNADGFGALHAAAEVNHAAVVPFLVAQGLDREARTLRGFTPLHVAVGLGHLDAIRALVAAGVDLAATSPAGDVHQIAAAEGKTEAAALLRELAAR